MITTNSDWQLRGEIAALIAGWTRPLRFTPTLACHAVHETTHDQAARTLGGASQWRSEAAVRSR